MAIIDVDAVLAAIGFKEASDFSEFCRGLGDDCPAAGDKKKWHAVWRALDEAVELGLCEVHRVKGRFDTAQLTEEGANRIREKLDRERGLFSFIARAQ
jgi:hypothetical protein